MSSETFADRLTADLNVQIGRRARKTRKAAGLTQPEVCQRTSEMGQPLSKATLSQLENGHRTWNLAYVATISRALEVDPAALVVEMEEQALLRAFRSGGVVAVAKWVADSLAK